MRRLAVVCLSLLLLTALSAQPVRARGQIKNASGAPEPQCQIDFYLSQQQQLSYRAYSDKNGVFFVDNPAPGRYDAVVTQGSRSYRFDVSIYNDGAKATLNPDTLIVRW